MHAFPRSISRVLALCVAGLAAMWLAAPAQAVDITATACTLVDYRVPVGSTVTFNIPAGCELWRSGPLSGAPSFSQNTAVGPTSVVIGIQGPDDWADLWFIGPDNPQNWVFACNVDIGDTEGSSYTISDSSPTGDAAAPPDVRPQGGAPTDGDCLSVEDASLDIGGASAGGWGRSWAEWANDGKGGPVCSRTLHYDPSVRHWVTSG